LLAFKTPKEGIPKVVPGLRFFKKDFKKKKKKNFEKTPKKNKNLNNSKNNIKITIPTMFFWFLLTNRIQKKNGKNFLDFFCSTFWYQILGLW
jgi:hypothetical protein